MEKLKKCSSCKVPKILDDFHKRKGSKDGHDHQCKLCSNTRHREKYKASPEHREKIKYNAIKRQYNLTKDELIKKFNEQDGKCKICKKNFKRKRFIYIDHNHKTGKIRGLLCPKCNTLLGYCNDDINILKSAILYLNEYK